MVFATVEQPTWDGFGSVRVVTEEGWINLSGTEKDQDTNIIDAIKWFINWTLGILGLIAMIMLLYWWFVMLTAVWNERYGSWFTIVKNALLWLVVIWLAWFVASAIFWITNLITEESVWTDAGTTSIIMPYLR
jgi:hypothetical protein